MSVIAWRHRREIRMGLEPKRRLLEGFAFRYQTGFGRFAAGDVEQAMHSRRLGPAESRTAGQPEALLLHSND
jgi:hypothetical protein